MEGRRTKGMAILLKIVQESVTDTLSGPVCGVRGHPGGERVE